MAKWIDVKLRVDTSRFSRKIARWRRGVSDLPQRALDYWIAQTPIKSGRARRSTELKGNVIHADYPYAGRLDEGWSGQSPRGMSRPTREWLEREWRRLFRRR